LYTLFKIRTISLNAAINGILTKYVNFYKRAEEYGSAVIVSTQFAVFIELMDEEKTTEIMSRDGAATMIAVNFVSFFKFVASYGIFWVESFDISILIT
jgi:hypothetical protein